MDERLIERMRELDERLAEIEPPPRLERRVLASITEPRPLPSALVLAGVGAAVVLAFWLGRRTGDGEPAASPQPIAVAPIEPATPSTPPPPVVAESHAPVVTIWGGALVPAQGCRIDGIDELRIEAGCDMVLRTPALTIDTWDRTRLQRRDDGVHVLDGEVLFAVEPVAPGADRVRVQVAAGTIEVIGTRFAVVQHGDDGHVDLLEGSIAFVDLTGTSHAVEPGHRLQWSQRAVIMPTRALPRGKPTTAARTDELDETLERVAALRRAGKWSDAIELLHRARRELKDGAAAEILSYEEGTLREHEDDAPAMCAYWRGHLARFGEGAHAPGARAQLERGGCDDP